MRPARSTFALCALALVAAAEPAPPDDPELALLRTGLRPSELARTEKAVGGLASLPRYLAEVEVDPDAGVYHGRVRISFVHQGDAPLGRVPLRTYPNGLPGLPAGRHLVLSGVAQDGKACKVVERTPTWHEVELAAPVAPGARAIVDVAFRGVVPELPPGATDPGLSGADAMASLLGSALGGAAKTEVKPTGVYGRADGLLTLGHLLPSLPSRRLDGAWEPDEPPRLGAVPRTTPATYLLAVIAPEGVAVSGSGCEVGSVPTPDGRRRTSLVATAVPDVGVVLGRGQVKAERAQGPLRLRVVVPEAHAYAAERLADLAASTVSSLETATGRPYPWAGRADAAAGLDGGAASADAPTLALVGSGHLLPPPPGLPYLLDDLIVHGIAHQWFGTLVASDRAREPVVDEAFALFAEALVAEDQGGARAYEARLAELVQPYHAYRLLGGADGKAARPADAFVSRLELGALLHGKAPHALAALRKALGKKAFQKVLAAYVERGAFRIADRKTLLDAIPAAKRKQAAALLAALGAAARGDELLGAPDPAAMLGATGFGAGPAPALPQALPGLPGGRPLTPDEQRQVEELSRQLAPIFDQVLKGLGGGGP